MFDCVHLLSAIYLTLRYWEKDESTEFQVYICIYIWHMYVQAEFKEFITETST